MCDLIELNEAAGVRYSCLLGGLEAADTNTKTKRKMYTTKSKNKDRTELAWRPKIWIASCCFIAFHFKNCIVLRYLNKYT